MKPWLKPFLILAGIAFFIGADWQTEIAWINLPFSMLWQSNWIALDFFRLLRYLIVIGLAAINLVKRQ